MEIPMLFFVFQILLVMKKKEDHDHDDHAGDIYYDMRDRWLDVFQGPQMQGFVNHCTAPMKCSAYMSTV